MKLLLITLAVLHIAKVHEAALVKNVIGNSRKMVSVARNTPKRIQTGKIVSKLSTQKRVNNELLFDPARQFKQINIPQMKPIEAFNAQTNTPSNQQKLITKPSKDSDHFSISSKPSASPHIPPGETGDLNNFFKSLSVKTTTNMSEFSGEKKDLQSLPDSAMNTLQNQSLSQVQALVEASNNNISRLQVLKQGVADSLTQSKGIQDSIKEQLTQSANASKSNLTRLENLTSRVEIVKRRNLEIKAEQLAKHGKAKQDTLEQLVQVEEKQQKVVGKLAELSNEQVKVLEKMKNAEVKQVEQLAKAQQKVIAALNSLNRITELQVRNDASLAKATQEKSELDSKLQSLLNNHTSSKIKIIELVQRRLNKANEAVQNKVTKAAQLRQRHADMEAELEVAKANVNNQQVKLNQEKIQTLTANETPVNIIKTNIDQAKADMTSSLDEANSVLEKAKAMLKAQRALLKTQKLDIKLTKANNLLTMATSNAKNLPKVTQEALRISKNLEAIQANTFTLSNQAKSTSDMLQTVQSNQQSLLKKLEIVQIDRLSALDLTILNQAKVEIEGLYRKLGELTQGQLESKTGTLRQLTEVEVKQKDLEGKLGELAGKQADLVGKIAKSGEQYFQQLATAKDKASNTRTSLTKLTDSIESNTAELAKAAQQKAALENQMQQLLSSHQGSKAELLQQVKGRFLGVNGSVQAKEKMSLELQGKLQNMKTLVTDAEVKVKLQQAEAQKQASQNQREIQKLQEMGETATNTKTFLDQAKNKNALLIAEANQSLSRAKEIFQTQGGKLHTAQLATELLAKAAESAGRLVQLNLAVGEVSRKLQTVESKAGELATNTQKSTQALKNVEAAGETLKQALGNVKSVGTGLDGNSITNAEADVLREYRQMQSAIDTLLQTTGESQAIHKARLIELVNTRLTRLADLANNSISGSAELQETLSTLESKLTQAKNSLHSEHGKVHERIEGARRNLLEFTSQNQLSTTASPQLAQAQAKVKQSLKEANVVLQAHRGILQNQKLEIADSLLAEARRNGDTLGRINNSANAVEQNLGTAKPKVTDLAAKAESASNLLLEVQQKRQNLAQTLNNAQDAGLSGDVLTRDMQNVAKTGEQVGKMKAELEAERLKKERAGLAEQQQRQARMRQQQQQTLRIRQQQQLRARQSSNQRIRQSRNSARSRQRIQQRRNQRNQQRQAIQAQLPGMMMNPGELLGSGMHQTMSQQPHIQIVQDPNTGIPSTTIPEIGIRSVGTNTEDDSDDITSINASEELQPRQPQTQDKQKKPPFLWLAVIGGISLGSGSLLVAYFVVQNREASALAASMPMDL